MAARGFNWVKYYIDGKPLRESTKTTDYEEALAFLAARVADVTKGKTANIQLNRVRFDDLSEDFLSDYRINIWTGCWPRLWHFSR